jgi:hypothetical protein
VQDKLVQKVRMRENGRLPKGESVNESDKEIKSID